MHQNRREFLSIAAMTPLAMNAGSAGGWTAERPSRDDISLAAWSLNRSFFVGKRWKLLDLPQILRKEFDINGLELVNQFFENPVQGYLRQLKTNANSHGISFVLIMVDGEGDMIAVDRKERIEAAIAHRKWIDIAHTLGCHAIRCNLGGRRDVDWKNDPDLIQRGAESFRHLLEYAKGANLNVVIENHGGASSNPDILVRLMKEVNNPDFGTLPDFGNINPGGDHYEVVRKLMPYAKGVSVKAGWAADGTHPRWDLERLLKICQEAGYHGFWGIESSFGAAARTPGAPEPTPDQIWANELQGVRLTKQVIERTILKKA